ncbi:class I SAM-dependent methyltransferase [Thioalkalivibrio thiocyanodenitrificans]|uniref:class I SAM-dependent methyltransferase n=1 Tax=Thioalkalivibrio thiocyanodenitrificans TaxID=243063 RepID=UPI000378AF11|nr:SAM-dependent methyltransferase [Thioalkalivibrio thiocyanodenitrificans]
MPDPHALPEPDAAARETGERLLQCLRGEIDRAGGFLPFRRYMELALYAPGLGYYAAGSRKLGAGGDFTTAPETSPLFARCLARQVAQVLEHLGGGDVLEFGAGSGVLAVDMLRALESLDRLPGRYLILELSPDLRARQQQAVAGLPDALRERVRWLDALPEAGALRGVVLANEVLDAMPVEVFTWTPDGVREKGVTWDGHALAWAGRPAGPELAAAVQRLRSETGGHWAPGYTSERNPGLSAWVSAVSDALDAGLILLIDYGYPRHEYYSAERSQGTLMGHYRHRALTDPLILPGLADLTAHVDFTAVAEAGLAAGLEVAGYTTQAWFLIGAGLDAAFQEAASEDPRAQIALAGQVRQLTLPGEMGERFQAMALTRGVPVPLTGFAGRDLRERL